MILLLKTRLYLCQDLEKEKNLKLYLTVLAIYGLIADYVVCSVLCIKGKY